MATIFAALISKHVILDFVPAFVLIGGVETPIIALDHMAALYIFYIIIQ